ncbi:MAG: hypothetical protein SCH71_06255 [Desulfobulbaceae bacterium]|nr:hypothetical protein [Desulfobulbaceae bacterium]
MYRILLILVMLALPGCGKVPMVHEFASMPGDAACRVALLPLIDKSTYPRGAAVFYKILLSELIASGHFQVVEEGDVLELYRQFKIYPNVQPSSEQLKMIGGRLGTTLFVGGDILRMEEHKTGGFLESNLTVVLRLYEGQSGTQIWTTYHRRRGSDYQQVLHFGRINTLTSLAKEMSREIINLWLEKGMKTCAG